MPMSDRRPPTARRRIAEETLDIYAPLAGRMGMQEMREELEDLSFRTLDPEAHAVVMQRLDSLAERNRNLISEIEKRVFADRAEYLGDPDFVRDPTAALLDPAYLARRAVLAIVVVAGVIILTDMFGGTPSNLAISVMQNRDVEVIAGVNLPMLVKLARVRGDEQAEQRRVQERDGLDDTIALLTDVSAQRSTKPGNSKVIPRYLGEPHSSTTSRRMRSSDAILTFVRSCTNARRSGPQPQRCPSVRANARLRPTPAPGLRSARREAVSEPRRPPGARRTRRPAGPPNQRRVAWRFQHPLSQPGSLSGPPSLAPSP